MTEAALLRVVGSLALIVLLILLMAWLARRSGWIRPAAARQIRVLGSHRLGTRSHITVVEVEGARLVLGVTPAQITLLHTVPPGSGSGPGEAGHDDGSGSRDPAQQASTTAGDAGRGQAFRRLLNSKLMWAVAAAGLLALGLPDPLHAQTAFPALTATPGADGSQTWSLSIQTLLLLTMMSFLPAMLLTMTGFTRVIIVLGLLRNAMGTGASPPNTVLIGLALFLTFFAMSPVFDQIYALAWQPLSQGQIALEQALALGAEPLREFMLHQTRETDLSLFAGLANLGDVDSPAELPLRVLIPSFVTSELKTAFQIGFTIFIPFLIIDLVVASILMSLGMMMVPPVTISLPFKLMLFVLADGWHLLLGSLARSFYQ